MNILNKLKRGMAGLLSLSVAVSAVFVFHFPLIKAHAAEDKCDHDHWEEWKEPNSLPTGNGCYYLSVDVTLQSDANEGITAKSWEPEDGTYLCLNGHQIKMADNDKYVITVKSGVRFDLYDCEREGENGFITHDSNYSRSGVCVEKGGTFNMYGGKISGNGNDEDSEYIGGGVYNKGTFNMHGGDISGNHVGGNGGGVYNNGTFNMDGGDIYGNSATNGGGVYNYGTFNMDGGKIGDNTAHGEENSHGVHAEGTFTVGGTATVAEGDNVYLPSGKVITISSKNPLWGEDTTIFVKTQAPLDDDDAEDVQITNPCENYRLFFESESASVYTIYKNGAIWLSRTNPDSEEYEDDGAIPKDYEPNPSEPDESDTSNESGESSEPTSSESSDSSDSSETSNSESSGDDNPGNNNDDKPHHANDTHAWKPFDKEKFESEAGFYYLESALPLTDTLNPANGTYLCLNGQKLSVDGDKPVISVSGKFTLCDNEGGGIVTHRENGGVGVSVENGGEFAMFGGEISGNKAEYGVTIADGGKITVGGNAKILDEVYLLNNQYITIDENKHLEDGAKIWVKTENAPAAANGETAAVNIPITYKSSADYSEFFHSNDYTTINIAHEEGNVVYLAADTEENHKHGEIEFEPITSEAELLAATEGNYYYLKNNITLTRAWTPEKNIYLCLNGKSITGTISGVTLYNCKSAGTANVTVSAGKTITVGGTLRANITLNDGALINVDSNYGLETGASITVTLGTPLADGGSAAITTANGWTYRDYFTSANPSYDKKNVGGAVVFENPKSAVVDPPAPTGHTHPVCGDGNCRDHRDITWTEWERSDRLPTSAGSYYLTRNVTLTSRWNVTSDIDLCLNGYTITMNYSDTAVYITEDLSLCDCDKDSRGTITHASGKTGRGVYIDDDGAFTMYGGTIKGNRASDGAGVYNDGVFDMLGGDITGNTATNLGGGLYNSYKATAYIEGDIRKNSASKNGGGVYQDGTLYVDEDAYIYGNTVGSGRNNVYLTDGSVIDIGSQFDGQVGVTLETYPKGDDSDVIAEGYISSRTANKILSDSSSYEIERSGDELTLSRKTGTSVGDGDLELEISSPLASSEIPAADRTAIINVLKDMPNWVVGAYYDVKLWDDDDEISETTRLIEVELTIPLSIRANNRIYKVVRVHNGKAEILDDVDSNPNTITVRSRYFSTYAIVYSVSQSNSGVGSNGNSGSNGGYGNPSMGVQNDVPLAALACGFTVMALAAPGKKLDQ